MKDYHKILILGGTRFFGEKIRIYLENEGYDVFTASNKKISNRSNHYCIDRGSYDDLYKLSLNNFDLVIDQICYNPIYALNLCRAFLNKTKKIIYTSSFDVYTYFSSKEIKSFNENELKNSSQIDFSEKWLDLNYNKQNYVLGKYLSENVFLNDFYFKDKICIIRLANVVDLKCDPTERFTHLYSCVLNGIQINNVTHRSSFIHSNEISYIYEKIISKDIKGVYNLSTIDDFSLLDMCNEISSILYKYNIERKEEILSFNEKHIIHPSSCIIDSSLIFSLIDLKRDFLTNIKLDVVQNVLK